MNHPDWHDSEYAHTHFWHLMKYARSCDKCGHEPAMETAVEGEEHWVCPKCNAMWRLDGLEKEHLYPTELETPKILEQLRNELGLEELS